MQKRKTYLFIIMLCVFLVARSDTLFAENEDELRAKVENSYRKGMEAAGVTSFHGYCTRATARQMEQVGIIDYKNREYPSGNGNTWFNYYKYRDGQTTSKGYYIVCKEGGNGLDELLETYGQPIYNIVVSYGTGGSYGGNHVMFIHAIVDDIVYFTDSFGYTLGWGNRVSEGQAWPSVTVKQYNNYYRAMYGDALGAVYFQPESSLPGEWVWDDVNSFWKYQLCNGKIYKGWKIIDGHQYYFKEDTSLTHSGFYEIDGNCYLFDTDGIMQTGWQKVDGEWYYLNEKGCMQKNTFVERDGNKFYLDHDGIMVHGICMTIDDIEYDVDNFGIVTEK